MSTLPAALSLIIPTYNRAGLLRECLKTLEHCGVSSLEVVIVDDGSTDDTEQVAAASPLKPLYLRQSNAGPGPARNLGFKHVHGEYICFLDSDDEWIPGAAAKALAFLQRHPEIDVLFADARMGNRADGFVSWIEVAGQDAFQKLPAREVEPGFRVLEREPFFRRMVERNAVFPGSALLRRRVFAESGGYDPRIFVAEDWNLLLQMATTRTFAYWNEPLAIYTKHGASLTANEDRMSRGFCEALNLLLTQVALTPDQRQWVSHKLHGHRHAYARRAMERGDYPEARRRYADLLRQNGFELPGLLLWASCALPFGIPRHLRRLKQWVSGTREEVPQQSA